MAEIDYRGIISRILKDIEVEFSEEFDLNFRRQGFFGKAWQRRKSPTRPGGSILIDSGSLRRSIISRTNGDSITFSSSLPYSEIHNTGGEIKVTRKMKAFFWHKYYESQGAFGRRKDGTKRKDKRTVQQTGEAEFWKAMALMKVGQSIKIPKRQFLGNDPKLEQAATEIIESVLEEYFNKIEVK